MKYSNIKLTPCQQTVLELVMNGAHRFYIMNWARRSGKNFIDLVLMIATGLKKEGTRSLLVAKNNKSARVTAYEVAVEMLRDQDVPHKANASTLEIRLDTGSILAFGSSETPDGFRGQEIDGILICDEIDFWGSAAGSNFEEMFEQVLRPLTSKTEAPIIITSTPKGVGMPLHKKWTQGLLEPDRYFLSHVTAYQAGIISESEIENAKKDMSPDRFKEEYMADFISASARVYPHFGGNNFSETLFDREVELYVGLDHNVGQSTAVIGQLCGKDTLEVIDEIVLTNSNTREMAISIKARFPNRRITVYPDPSGKARKTSAEIGVTDHTILEEEGLIVVSPSKAPLVVDRINCTNNKIYTADGQRHVLIDPSCKVLIEALSFHLYDEKKGVPQKGGADRYDDTNDSLGYLLWGLFGDRFLGYGETRRVSTTDFYG